MGLTNGEENPADGGKLGKHHWGTPGAGNHHGGKHWPLLGPTQSHGFMKNQKASEKHDHSEQNGSSRSNRLQGLEACPHMRAGCSWRGNSNELSRHLASNVGAHLTLVTAECRRQAEEIDRLRGKLEEASVGREVVVIIVVTSALIIIHIRQTSMNVNMMPQHDHHQGVLVWRVAGVKARLEEARSSQGLELVPA